MSHGGLRVSWLQSASSSSSSGYSYRCHSGGFAYQRSRTRRSPQREAACSFPASRSWAASYRDLGSSVLRSLRAGVPAVAGDPEVPRGARS